MGSERSLVARRIEEIRTAKKISRQALAVKLGTTRLQVWRYETGVTDISADAIASIADALDVSVASLFRETEAVLRRARAR